MEQYSKNIKIEDLNPMETAPVWDYYDGDVETIELFFWWNEVHTENHLCSVIAFYDRKRKAWAEWYSEIIINEELIGWLPKTRVVIE